MPFQIIGSPYIKGYTYNFTPRPLEGFDKNPLHKNQTCHGLDLRKAKAPEGLSLKYVIELYQAYRKAGKADEFFTRASWFDLLMGTSSVRQAIIDGKDETTIKNSWQKELDEYNTMRKRYAIYPET